MKIPAAMVLAKDFLSEVYICLLIDVVNQKLKALDVGNRGLLP